MKIVPPEPSPKVLNPCCAAQALIMSSETGSPETIALAADHGGFELKTVLAEHLRAQGFNILDVGTHSLDAIDYPDIAEKLVEVIRTARAKRGVLMCGTGIGASMAANRHAEIRAALCHDVTTARFARQHNDANVLVLGGRTTGPETAKNCLDVFLATPFEGGRHARRVGKLGARTPAC
jgi:ribose 5-phosphate isomerase B